MRSIYYTLKPFIPRWFQIALRRRLVLLKRTAVSDIWPIDQRASEPPNGWSGWPDKKKFALILTHDVDTAKGHDNCYKLIQMEEKLGFRSSFNFVPKRYNVSTDLRQYLVDREFEVGIHGLYHDGNLYKSREIFQARSALINQYIKEWKVVGFRSPAMHHNLDWLHDLNIEYDASTFDTDPFEPQPDGVGTIFPFWVRADSSEKGYVELPYTLSQDFTPFILMKEQTINIWTKKLDWIAKHGGMVLVNTHPDYMNFCGGKPTLEEYPAEYYEQFLNYVKTKYEDQYWHALPQDMAQFWKQTMVQSSEPK